MMEIRSAAVSDAEAILAIYTPHVLNTAITFEYDVPSLEEFRSRIRETLKRYPYLVATQDGRVVGYAYAGSFRIRPAYQHIAEMSIYVDQKYRQHGIGRILYKELEKRLARQNVFSLYAIVTIPNSPDDAHATDESLHFHERMGYTKVGEYPLSGYKFGQWYSVACLEKDLCDRPDKPESFIPFSLLK